MIALPLKAVNLFLFALALILPMKTNAETSIKVCAHPQGHVEYYMTARILAFRNDLPIAVSPYRLSDKCYQIGIPVCDNATRIEVTSGRTYSGKAACSGDPSPMLIAMEANREEIIMAALKSRNQPIGIGLDIKGFLATIGRTDAVISGMPDGARVADSKLYLALEAGNFATAQRQANELSGYFRESGNERLSLAYSTITYVSGFRAIGFDSLSVDNPLVTIVGSPDPSFAVISKEGKNLLQLYQFKRAVSGESGAWDFWTAKAVSTIEPSPQIEVVAAPTESRWGDLIIDRSGRMVLNEGLE